MKNDKICVRKNLMYLFLISVFAVLFVVTVNYINSQQKETSSRATLSVQQVLAACQSVKGQVSRVVENYGGAGVSGYDHFNGNYKSVTTPNPLVTPIPDVPLSAYCATEGKLTSVGTAPVAAYTVKDLIANCATIKGQVSRVVADYGGAGVNGYDHFNGQYYSTTKKTPNVTPIEGKDWSAYCATEGKLTSVGTAPVAAYTVKELISICQQAKGYAAKKYADYGGTGRDAYTKFTGGYYDTVKMNTGVDSTFGFFRYCATSGQPVLNWCSGYIQSVCGDRSVDATCAWTNGACVPAVPSAG